MRARGTPGGVVRVGGTTAGRATTGVGSGGVPGGVAGWPARGWWGGGGWRTSYSRWTLPGFTTHRCGRICNAQLSVGCDSFRYG